MTKSLVDEQVKAIFDVLGTKPKLKTKLRLMSESQLNKFQTLILESLEDVMKEREDDAKIKQAINEQAKQFAEKISAEYKISMAEARDLINSNI
jgi:hypothetical protein